MTTDKRSDGRPDGRSDKRSDGRSDKRSDGRNEPDQGTSEGPGARPQPIDVARVRHLLKTTRYNAATAKERAARSAGVSLFGPRDTSRSPPPRAVPRIDRPVPDSRADARFPPRGTADARSRSPAPKPDLLARGPAGGSQTLSDGARSRPAPAPARQRKPEAPPRVHRAPDPSPWFAAQPEMQRLAQLSPRPAGGEDAGEPDAGDESHADAGRAPRSFYAFDQQGWFAHQPEVQRFANGESMPAGLERHPPGDGFHAGHVPPEPENWNREYLDVAADEAPPQAPDRRSWSNDPQFEGSQHGGAGGSAFAVAPATHAAAGAVSFGDFGDASPWFANQPEFQRMRVDERARGRRPLAGWIPAAIVVAIAGGVIWGAGLVTLGDLAEIAAPIRFERLRAVVGPDRETAPGSGIAVTPAPVVVLPQPPRPAASAEPEVAKARVERAPTAVGPVVPQAGGVTRIAKTQAQQESAVPAFTGTVDLGARPAGGGAGAGPADPAQQSVLTPTGSERRTLPEADDGASSGDDNPFRGFSEDGAGGGESAAPGAGSGEHGAELGTGTRPVAAGGIGAVVGEARHLFVGGDHAGAGRLLHDLLESHPDHVPALKLYGDTLVASRDLGRAADVYARILKVNPNDDQTMVDRGNALLGTGRPAEAAGAAEQALAIAADSIPATLLLSKASAASGDMRAAMGACERIGILTSSRSEVEWCRAAAQNQAGNTFVGVRMYISALNTGEQGFVRAKQVFMRNRGLYGGPIDGASSQGLIDAITECAAASDCIL